MVWITTSICIYDSSIYVTNMVVNVPSKDETVRNGRWSNAIPDNYTYAYENRKS